MAKYTDYVQQGIDDEIDEAAQNQRARDERGRFIPDRFKGKDITDVIKSYEELEQLQGRTAQELGETKKTVDQLLELQTLQSNGPTEETATPLSAEDLYEDPDSAVRRVVKEETSSEVKELREELNQLRIERKFAELDKKFPEWQTRSNSPEFLEWAKESPYRVRMAQAAASGDFDAAEDILGMYYESNAQEQASAEEEQRQERRTQDLNDAMLETGGPAPLEMVDTFSRTELQELRLAAKRGDLKAERWLQGHADAIAIAYAEGRIVD